MLNFIFERHWSNFEFITASIIINYAVFIDNVLWLLALIPVFFINVIFQAYLGYREFIEGGTGED